jgi:hypothetical protein
LRADYTKATISWKLDLVFNPPDILNGVGSSMLCLIWKTSRADKD